MSKQKDPVNPKLRELVTKAIEDASKNDIPWTQRKEAIELGMKFEALCLKSKGKDFGKGFTEEDDDDAGAF